MSNSGELLENRRDELLFPRAVGFFSRMRLWIQGFIDAKKRMVWRLDHNQVTSLHIKTIADANLRIAAEWQEANKIMFKLAAELEQVQINLKHVKEELRINEEIKQKESKDIKIDKYDGDLHVGNNLRLRRENRRLILDNKTT